MRETMPEIWARWHYPIAQLCALVANGLGGKPDPSKPRKETIPEHLLYTPEDFLPDWYARFDAQSAWSERALEDAAENAKRLPSWAYQMIPWGRIKLTPMP